MSARQLRRRDVLLDALHDGRSLLRSLERRSLRVPLHRMNRVEYANAIREILSLDIDPAVYLPADDSSYGFDNVVSGLQVSPALVVFQTPPAGRPT